jgi:hypothetical protein
LAAFFALVLAAFALAAFFALVLAAFALAAFVRTGAAAFAAWRFRLFVFFGATGCGATGFSGIAATSSA